MRSILLITALLIPLNLFAECRYFECGNGHINISSKKNTKTYKGQFRLSDGTYSKDALRKINQVFDASGKSADKSISIRLIEWINKLANDLSATKIILTSGYRSPDYNKNLRKNGGLAAKASLHQYGMALDAIFKGVNANKVAKHAISQKVGGVGYYHGNTVHLDTGPPRNWDEKTTGVGTGISNDNKVIMIDTDKDIYKAGEYIDLKLARMTAWPIGIKGKFYIVNSKGKMTRLNIASDNAWRGCKDFSSVKDVSSFKLGIPAKIKQGRYKVMASFCDKKWDKMPDKIYSRNILIKN